VWLRAEREDAGSLLWTKLWSIRAMWKVRGDMKAFYGTESVIRGGSVPFADIALAEPLYKGTRARIAVYDGPASSPYVEDVESSCARDFIESLSSRVHELSLQRGGRVPFSVIREIVENYVHADFAEPVVSVLDSGSTLRFSDQGPGITDKQRALQPGFTTATASMKDVIRGVGSGLPIVADFLSVSGGALSIEDNLHGGTVITVSLIKSASPAIPIDPCPRDVRGSRVSHGAVLFDDDPLAPIPLFGSPPPASAAVAGPRLTTRQKQVLALVMENGSAGPTIVSRELGVGLSTAYRDLASLEDLGLISSAGGKRALTAAGMSYLETFSSPVTTSSSMKELTECRPPRI
jgi:hypothetical protein